MTGTYCSLISFTFHKLQLFKNFEIHDKGRYIYIYIYMLKYMQCYKGRMLQLQISKCFRSLLFYPIIKSIKRDQVYKHVYCSVWHLVQTKFKLKICKCSSHFNCIAYQHHQLNISRPLKLGTRQNSPTESLDLNPKLSGSHHSLSLFLPF